MGAVVPVPLLTPQVHSAHPFYTGEKGQTARSKNAWIDERGRINRRPRIWSLGDVPQALRASSLFPYEFRSPSSRSERVLVMFQERDVARALYSTATPAVSLFEGKPINELAPGTDIVAQGTRFRATDVNTVHAGTVFEFDEKLNLYLNASAGDSGSGVLWGFSANDLVRVVVDNVDFGVPDGSMIFRIANTSTATISPLTNVRIEGVSSGANVHFDTLIGEPRMRTIWTAPASDAFPLSANMTFAQFGRVLFFADDSFRFPVRAWSGGIADAEILAQAPVGSIVFVHQGRLWVSGLERNASELVGSRLYNPFDWDLSKTDVDDAISIEIESNDREAVTGAVSTPQGDLLVFKERSTHRITGQIRNPRAGSGREYQAIELSSSIGCAAHRTAWIFGNDVVWASNRGVHSAAATDRYGDVETAYLSFPIADLWKNLSVDRLAMMQAVVQERLGLYVLGMPTTQSRYLNRLAVYARSSQRWHVWDIGPFTSIGIGPGRSGESDGVYVSRVVDWTAGPSTLADMNMLALLDFSDQIDFDMSIANNSSTAIPVILEPGDIFGAGVEAALRYVLKNPVALQVYLAPSGDFESDLIYSLDGGEETTEKIGLNPSSARTYGGGFRLGAPGGNLLSSRDETRVATVAVKGSGKTLRLRIEDSNKARLPYLHADLEFTAGGSQWSSGRE